jgi:hypothetical protein
MTEKAERNAGFSAYSGTLPRLTLFLVFSFISPLSVFSASSVISAL